MKKNQVNRFLPSLPNGKGNGSNAFQVMVAGSLDKVKRFWYFIKNFSGYRFSYDYRKLSEQLDRGKDIHVVLQLEETPYFLSRFHRKVGVVQIQTIDGKLIEFPLLNVQVVEMLNQMVYIQGKSYDIFANPILDPRNASELVVCEVIDKQGEENPLQ